MFAQLPLEIVDHIVEYLDFDDVRSIARVCSAFQLPAQLRLFKAIQIVSDAHRPYTYHTQSILSSPHLLQYSSRLVVRCVDHGRQISFHSLWPRLPMMYRLSSMDICVDPNDCSSALSALESLGSEREIALILRGDLAPNCPISDNPLPVHSLELNVGASNHHVVTRLVQKCSQSLRKLTLIPKDNTIPSLPFLSHLCEFSVTPLWSTYYPDLMSWFPFLNRHPTITRMSLGCRFSLAVELPPNLLPNLQFLSATPKIIERLMPGRPVDDIHVMYLPQPPDHFPVDIMLRPLRRPFVSVTTLAITADVDLPNDSLINIVQALPKLCKFTLFWRCYEGSVDFHDLLIALGRCKDMVHIQISPWYGRTPHYIPMPLWSKGNFVQMVQMVQENGAAGLWGFRLGISSSNWGEGCRAMRVGWLDVPGQPTLRGEWKFDVFGSSSDSDVPIPSNGKRKRWTF